MARRGRSGDRPRCARPFFRRSRSPKPRRCNSRCWPAVLRACAVFLVAAQVTAGTLREIQDKGLELMLSLPLSRTTHYLGRLAGFVALRHCSSRDLLCGVTSLGAAAAGRALGRFARLRGCADRRRRAFLRHDAAQRRRRHRRHGGPLSARPRHARNPGARRHAARDRDVGRLARARRRRHHRLRAAPRGRRDAHRVAGLRRAAARRVRDGAGRAGASTSSC